MANSKIDELNILNAESSDKDSSSIFDYHDFILHYFDPMQISGQQKKKRIEAAEEIFDAVLLFLIWCENAPERVQEEVTQRSFENIYKEVIFQYSDPDDYFDKYVSSFIRNLILVTLDHQGEEYFTSIERAANIAVNESNLVLGKSELQEAIDKGFKKKRWCTELDERVRPTHAELEGWTIPIEQPFLVGESLMMFPKDQFTFNADPQEIVNCRCVCEYL